MNNKERIISIVIIIALAMIILTNKGCVKSSVSTKGSIDTVIQNANIIDNRIDSIIKIKNDSISILNGKLLSLQNNDKKIIKKYIKIHDTISNTPDINSQQFNITKSLCPSTGDSIDLKQINFCLEEGNQAIELFGNAQKELKIKDSILIDKDKVIQEVYQENDVKDGVIVKEKASNDNLNKNLDKQYRRKKFWRNAALVTTTVAIVFGIIIF